MRGIRDDEQVVQVAGKNVTMLKVKAFAFGTAALGLGGALYGHFTSYIAPDLFAPLLTLYVKLALLAGGLGNNRGAVLGAIVVVTFLESTRFVIPLIPFISAVQGAALREILIAVAASGDPALLQAGTYSGDHSATGTARHEAGASQSGDR